MISAFNFKSNPIAKNVQLHTYTEFFLLGRGGGDKENKKRK